MKKTLATILVVMLLASMANVASAIGHTTTLTTTVPAATYTLNIPANQEIVFGTVETSIGAVTVSEGTGFASNKNLRVTVEYGAFTSNSTNSQIPLELVVKPGGTEHTSHKKESGSYFVFKGQVDGTVSKYASELFESRDTFTSDQYFDVTDMFVVIYSPYWSKALAGEYTATITFTAEVVVEQ